MPAIEPYATNNAHMFYLVCDSLDTRTRLIDALKQEDIMAVFHYQSLHRSPYYADKYTGGELPNSDRYTDTLVRLPMYYELTEDDVDRICATIHNTL